MIDDSPGRGIRLGIAGAGHWHLQIDARYLELARAAGVEIVGLTDEDEKVARARAALVDCPWTIDVVDLVERFKPDLVLAMPRPDRAPGQISTLLDLGVPLFVEKPLGLRADDVWPLVERAERGWVAVAFPNRHLPIWQLVERLRSQDRLGKLVHFGARLLKGSPERYIELGVPWMLDAAICGGGPIRNFGIHLADLINWQFGPAPASVAGARKIDDLYQNAIDDYGAAVIETANGVVANLEVGYSLAARGGTDFEIRLATSQAYFVQRRDRVEAQLSDGSTQSATIESGQSAYGALFFDALRRLRRGSPPSATVRDCATANALIDAIYAAAEA